MEIRRFSCNKCFVNFEQMIEDAVSDKPIVCPVCSSTDIRSKTKTIGTRYAGCSIACPAATPERCSACPNRGRF